MIVYIRMYNFQMYSFHSFYLFWKLIIIEYEDMRVCMYEGTDM